MDKLKKKASGSLDLSEMQNSIRRVSSSTSLAPGSRRKEPEREALFVEMAKWNPRNPEDRAKYNDTTVKRLLRRKPEAARAMYDFELGGRGNLTVTRYPLSHLVALEASKTVIVLAVRANPAALKPSSDFRSTPLHTACSCPNTSMDVVKYIYEQYPEAIQETTNFVFLPLHNACQAAGSLELIQFLVEAYPQGLMTMNKLGDTPLRTAQRNPKISKEVLDYLEQETERVFGLEENKDQKMAIEARQSWGLSTLRDGCRDFTKTGGGEIMDNGTEHSGNTVSATGSSCDCSEGSATFYMMQNV